MFWVEVSLSRAHDGNPHHAFQEDGPDGVKIQKNSVKDGSRPLPTRRPSPVRSRKNGSYRGSLGHVAEEADEEEAASGCDSAASPASSVERPLRWQQPVARSTCHPQSSLEGGVTPDHCVHSSAASDRPDVKGPLASLEGKNSLARVESVNIMDFGVDQEQIPYRDDSTRLRDKTSSGSTSYPLDEDDFLGWDNSYRERSPNASSLGKDRNTPVLRRPGSCDSNLSNLSNLVDSAGFLGWDSRHCSDDDSAGFLGWESRHYMDDDSQDLTPAGINSTTNLDRKKDAPVTNASWHIEDYEDTNGALEAWATSHPKRTLSHRLRRLSLDAADRTVATARGLCRETGASAPQEAVRTADLKQLLLARRACSSEELDHPPPGAPRRSGNSADGHPARHPASLRTLFGKKVDERSRSINLGDNVDIGELRRELEAGGTTGAAGKRWLNLPFL